MRSQRRRRVSWDHVAREGLTPPAIAASYTGAGIVAALVDTGINFGHPHLALPARGWSVRREDGEIVFEGHGFSDRYGHGTCCAALLHLLAPGASLLAVRVTAERPMTDADRLAAGIEKAAEEGAVVIAVPMGTRTRLGGGLQDAVHRALGLGAVVVAANPDDGLLPAGCAGAIPAHHRDGVDVMRQEDRIWAEGRARPAEGHRRNFWGASLATARVAAALARVAEQTGDRGAALAAGFPKVLDVR